MPDNLATDVFVAYSLMEVGQDGKFAKKGYQTKIIERPGQLADFNFVQDHIYMEVTDQVLDYVQTQNVCFELQGYPVKSVTAKPLLTGSEVFNEAVSPEPKLAKTDGPKALLVDSTKVIQPQRVVPEVLKPGLHVCQPNKVEANLINDYNSKLLQTKHTRAPPLPPKTVASSPNKNNTPKDAKDKKKERKKSGGFMSFFGL